MAELITMALFCGALIVCIIAGISIIPALLAGVVIFLAHGRLTGHTFTADSMVHRRSGAARFGRSAHVQSDIGSVPVSAADRALDFSIVGTALKLSLSAPYRCPNRLEHSRHVIDFCKTWWARIATKEMVFVGIVTLAASLVASWLKQFPGFSLFGALIIAMLIGMVAQFPIRKWYSSRSVEHRSGVKDAAGLISNKLLRLGIILLGFKLNLTVLFTQGIKCLPIAAVVVTLTIVVCYAIARKFGVDPQLAILVAGGTGICGAAAVMGLSGSIKVPPEKEDEKADNEVMAVAIVAIMGTIFALLEIALGPLTGLSKTQLGITAGASLHEIAHAVAAGDAFGAVDIATIMKLSRVLMLVFAAIVIAVWWDKNHSEMPADGKRKVSFPWFMLGFIGASIIGTFVPFIGAIAPNLVDFAYIVLGMAMAALGINVNFSAIVKKGQKAFLASFITSVLLMCFAAGVSALFF